MESFINNKDNFYSTEAQTISDNNISLSDFIHTSSEYIIDNEYLLRYSGIPFGINLTPFPDIDDSLIKQFSFGNSKIPRCVNCKSFINSFCKNDYNGWRCNICATYNKITNNNETISKIFNSGEVYEIFANSDYIDNSPMSSNYLFIIDVTNKNIENGSFQIFIDTIRYIVNNHFFINEERTFISFITFDNEGICFYKINKKNNNSIQIFQIGGDEPFIPENKKNLIYPVDDNLDCINALIDMLESLYNANNIKNKSKDSDMLIFAIECGKCLLQNKGGKLIVINSTVGWKNKLYVEEQNNLNNNENKNKNNDSNIELNVKNDLIDIGKALTKYQITCDIFELQITNESHFVNPLCNICNYSNGNFIFIKNFNYTMHYYYLYYHLFKSLTNQKANEIIIQYYVSPNMSLNENLSIIPAQVKNSFLFPSIEVNQTYSFILHYKEFRSKENQELINNTAGKQLSDNLYKIINLNEIYLQFSIIYTSLEGVRIIRVINKKILVCRDKMEYYKNIDIKSCCTTLTKLYAKYLINSNNITNSIAEYKNKYLDFASSNFKIMKFNELLNDFMICYLGIMKHKYFCIEPTKYKLNSDELFYGKNSLLNLNVEDILNIIIPKIYDITNVLKGTESFENVYYQPITLIKENLQENKIYLIDNGIYLNLHFTRGEESKQRLKIFFGKDVNFENIGKNYYSEQMVFEENEFKDNFEVEKCKEIINNIRNNKKRGFQDLFFSFQGSQSESLINQCFICSNLCPWFKMSYNEAFKKI